MSKQSKEIRDIMDDIKGIMNESYMFGEKSEDSTPNPEQIVNKKPENSTPIKSEDPIRNSNTNKSHVNIDESIKKIREIAIRLLIELDPASSPEESKLVKGIWDGCDKFLTNKNKPEEGNENNNNI